MDDCPIKTSIYKGFSMAMLNNQRVIVISSNSLQHLGLPSGSYLLILLILTDATYDLLISTYTIKNQ